MTRVVTGSAHACKHCWLDIAERKGRWLLAAPGAGDPAECSPGQKHEPVTDWDAFWAGRVTAEASG